MKKEHIIQGIYLLLVLLFSYTALSKLSDTHTYRLELEKQVFSKPIIDVLFYLIPGIEILTAVLLITIRFRLAGFMLSVLLLMVFTGYIVLILTGYYNRIPCACGGVLSMLNWNSHLWFNLIFLALASLGSILQYQLKVEGSDNRIT